MKTTTVSITLTLLLGVVGAGCGKEQPAKKDEAAATAATPAAKPADPPPATPPPDTAAPATPPPASADVAPEATAAPAVPTEQDFEAKAKTDVDSKNLESEVKKMEKELGVK